MIIVQMAREELLAVIRDLLDAEASYRIALNVYADNPTHPARISAESRWYHAKLVAKTILSKERA